MVPCIRSTMPLNLDIPESYSWLTTIHKSILGVGGSLVVLFLRNHNSLNYGNFIFDFFKKIIEEIIETLTGTRQKRQPIMRTLNITINRYIREFLTTRKPGSKDSCPFYTSCVYRSLHLRQQDNPKMVHKHRTISETAKMQCKIKVQERG